jgi:hypothetical protein
MQPPRVVSVGSPGRAVSRRRPRGARGSCCRPKRKTPARFSGGRNSNWGFSPMRSAGSGQKMGVKN